MKVLVTGGAGFIGSHIVTELLKNQHEVVVVDNLCSGDRHNLPADIRFVVQNVVSNLNPLFEQERFDAVIHLAAQVSVPCSIQDPLGDLRVNLEGLLWILEACRRHQVRKIVFASSAAVYGPPKSLPITEEHPLIPVSPYGLTKKSAEEYLRIYYQLYGIEFTVLRFANVYGPRQSVRGECGVIAIFADALCRGRIPTIHGDGSATRDYVFVEDVARATVLALHKGHCDIFNVSTSMSVELNQLFANLTTLLDRQIKPSYGPSRVGDIQHSRLSNERIRNVLGWQPEIALQEGLERTVEWLQSVRR
ncbi:NAD-dependent epimerase/dehydratase family protein [Effusibacillus consociatus]|uniref:NAD-dependent epimerase/dehydratase family protein n=1 Tax=Effusibacillus consociatus TaxID=1117041 RepID=A0ABV9PZ50_9BACL